MAIAQFNMKQINKAKDILLRLHHGESTEEINADFYAAFKDTPMTDILLAAYELKSGDYGITAEDIMKLFKTYEAIFDHAIHNFNFPEAEDTVHPLQIFIEENKAFRSVLEKISNMIETYDKDKKDELIEEITLLGQFYSHYNRKEKIFFPIMERYGHYTLTRTMWGDDDRIRTLYKGTKTMMQKLGTLDFNHIKKAYESFERKFKDMIFQEETFLLPILLSTFEEKDWSAIANESNAFGYAMLEPNVKIPREEKDVHSLPVGHLPLGGGFLTIEEADHILNNLPLEITFVDKNGIFKYFNEIVEASEMMFIRTPSSIGRNVANCHPPKSLSKVMRLIRDLKVKKRASENMWFKKDGKYVHITYKGLFNKDDEFLGILEYVQDIQPFLDLPREVKKELSQQ